MAAIVTLSLLPACGKSLPKLTAEQKETFAQTLDSATRARAAIPGTPPSVHNRTRMGALDWILELSSRNVSHEPASVQLGSMRERMISARDGRQCAIQTADPKPARWGGSLTVPRMDLHVTGDSCPIRMNLSLEASESETRGSGAFRCQYQVLDPAYAQLNDVDSIDLSGAFSLEAGAGQDIEGKLEIHGKIHSQKEGEVRVDATGSLSGKASLRSASVDGDVTLRFEFPSFTAELRQKVRDGDATYFLNDHEVSAEEFSSYLKRAGMN